GVRFPGQARIHARRYLAGVADAIEQLGGSIHEQSPTQDFDTDARSVTVNGHTVTFEHLVVATHNPIMGLASATGVSLFQTKLALYTSYVVAARVPRGTVPDALWWDTANPYTYIRLDAHDDHDVVILGGEDHKTGQQDDTVVPFRRLEERLAILVPDAKVSHRWSGQVIETPDGLPYIGESADHQFTATGFAGNGMTFGTLAGTMIADALTGRTNPWFDLFHPRRKALTRGLWDYLSENADYPYYMIRDRFAGPEARSLREVKRGQGAVIERDGQKVAAFRNADGTVVMCSATCTHMGCTVEWNAAERTWDCPCHGSRFQPGGEVISGPAESPLPRVK
ncbi:MAG: FAD-dependent oxidoreductase, partial [Vicinamibacterales bacterium]